MDSTVTIIQHIVTDTLVFDSLNQKLNELQTLAAKQQSIPFIQYGLPFLSALLVAGLVLLGQSIERKKRREVEIQNSLREIYAFSRKLEALMKSHYTELAMAKVHAQYWWHCHVITTRQDYYEKHLSSQSFAREVERKIGETKAEFIGQVRNFQAIQEINQDVEEQLLVISDLTNAKAKIYDSDKSHQEVRHEMAEQDEIDLREKYYANLIHFKSINDYLYTQIKSKSDNSKCRK